MDCTDGTGIFCTQLVQLVKGGRRRGRRIAFNWWSCPLIIRIWRLLLQKTFISTGKSLLWALSSSPFHKCYGSVSSQNHHLMLMMIIMANFQLTFWINLNLGLAFLFSKKHLKFKNCFHYPIIANGNLASSFSGICRTDRQSEESSTVWKSEYFKNIWSWRSSRKGIQLNCSLHFCHFLPLFIKVNRS